VLRIPNILFPTDFSSYSNQAYLHAVAIAEAHHSALTLVYVNVPGQAGAAAYWRAHLEQIGPANPALPVTHVFLEGDPATEIVRSARDAGVDRIVMGTHGRTGTERLLMGSVAEKVLRDAPCSVLVVKLPRARPGANKADPALVAGR